MKNFVLMALANLLICSSLAAQDWCPAGKMKSNTILTPAFYTHTSAWQGFFYITNVSQETITVRLRVTDGNGSTYAPQSLQYNEFFSATNTPTDLTNGAILSPGQSGEIAIKDDAIYAVNVGELSWTSSTCIDYALMANHRNVYSPSGRISASYIVLNGGKPF